MKKFFVSHIKYARSLLGMFRMTNCKIWSTPIKKGMKILANIDFRTINELFYKPLVGSLI
jgi:hypothetical protein